ncbi:MAG: hypothetical protein IPP60_13910 [Sphingobacteriales bacterium]|nr:hypothetical protein [Sphingobacteriales bacterium]
MVIEGEIEIDGNVLTNRDAIGITEAKAFEIKCCKLQIISGGSSMKY